MSALYENQDASFNPFERHEFSASASLPIADDVAWRSTASTFETRFKGEFEKERGTTVTTDVDVILGPSTRLNFRGEYRRIDLRTDEGDGYLVETIFVHRFRETEIDFRLQYSDEEFDVASDQEIFYAQFTITRRF